jgi:hypothetical protein
MNDYFLKNKIFQLVNAGRISNLWLIFQNLLDSIMIPFIIEHEYFWLFPKSFELFWNLWKSFGRNQKSSRLHYESLRCKHVGYLFDTLWKRVRYAFDSGLNRSSIKRILVQNWSHFHHVSNAYRSHLHHVSI